MKRTRHPDDVESIISPGDRNRSVFELSESGASKALLDSVQFHLDGLFSLKSAHPRLQCAIKLIEICTSSKQVIHAFRKNGIAVTLLRVVGLLASESDSSLRLCLQALALILLQSDSGDVLEGFTMPKNVFSSLLSSILPQNFPQNSSTSLAAVKESQPINSTNEIIPMISSNIHRKRKFVRKSGGAVPSSDENASDSVPLIRNILTECFSRTQNIPEDCNSTICSGNESIRTLQLLWPSFFFFCGFLTEHSDRNSQDSAFEIGRLLSLTIISRFITSLVQHDTQSQSKSCYTLQEKEENLNINPDENKEDSKEEGKSVGTSFLAEYQILLRKSSKNEINKGINREVNISVSEKSEKNENSFLTKIVQELSKEIFEFLKSAEDSENILSDNPKNIGKNNSKHSSNKSDKFDKVKSFMGENVPKINFIYQVLCLLDAACFRCSENQVHHLNIFYSTIFCYQSFFCMSIVMLRTFF